MNRYFSIISYNIWFDITDQEERLLSLIETLKYQDADFVCLQEVVPEVVDILTKELKDVYKYIYPEQIELGYGCMILSKHEPTEYIEYEFEETKMGRKLHLIILEDLKLVIATAHFESEFRKINLIKTSQYEQAHEILNDLHSKHYTIVLCSDTNILEHEESHFITTDRNWLDVWNKFETEDELNTYTYDTKLNQNLINRNFQKQIRSRIDRIIYCGFNINPINFKLIKGLPDLIEPSDHFGVFTKFNLSSSTIGI